MPSSVAKPSHVFISYPRDRGAGQKWAALFEDRLCAWGIPVFRDVKHGLGLDIRLPTEWEWQWERAARGTDGRIYPWGNVCRIAHANIDETWDNAGPHRLGRTTAVGIYPQGASPEGVLDLAGNVSEWCLNEYANPERTQRGGGESRVLRGGSWYCDRVLARADVRDYFHPLNRFDSDGFRVVCSSPIR